VTEKFSQLSEERRISGMGVQKATEKFSQGGTKAIAKSAYGFLELRWEKAGPKIKALTLLIFCSLGAIQTKRLVFGDDLLKF